MKINEIIIPTSVWQQHKDCIPRELTTCQDRQSSGFLLYFGSRKVPVPPPRHTSVDQRGKGGSPGVPPQQQASSTPPHPAGCWRVHLYHSIQNLALQQPTKPRGSHSHAWVHLCPCGWGDAHASTALENNFVGDMQEDSSHIHKFRGSFLSQSWLFYPACRFISKIFTHTYKKPKYKMSFELMGLSVQYASIREGDCNQKYIIISSTTSQKHRLK